jgi:hypothetical protein
MCNRSLIIPILLFSSALVTHAQYGTPATSPNHPAAVSSAVCPWLTQGSAAHALAGNVSVTVKVADSGEGSCRFSRPQDSHDSLEIAVSKGALRTCSAKATSLRGIGNEAARCKVASGRGESAEMISSRVRDLFFTITLVSRNQKSSAKAPDPQDDGLEQIAEQVAGNLY